MIITRTPFRISFFGGGTDYPAWFLKNGGAVLSASIDKYCYILCRHLPPFFEHKSRIVWSKIENVANHDEIIHPSARETLKFMGFNEGIEVHHHGDLPARGGLGSSSAFTVGLLNALYALKGDSASSHQLALDAIHIEQNLIKENVGCQDQVATAVGGINKIEFGGPDKVKVSPVVIGSEKTRLLEDHLMLFFVGLARHASEIAAEQIRNIPQKHEELKNMRAMVDSALDILKDKNGNLENFGKLLHETWQIKRTLSSQITNKFIDDTYEAALSAGALGGKILGAGAGGFLLLFARPESHARIKEKLKNLLYVPFRFENLGSQIIYTG